MEQSEKIPISSSEIAGYGQIFISGSACLWRLLSSVLHTAFQC